MDPFLEFVLDNKKQWASTDFTKTPIHLVIGNESCDLDSMICTLGLAYYHHQKHTKIPNDCVVLPILNIPMKEFIFHTENCYVLNQFGITEDNLLFRDSLDLEEIARHGLLSVSIVDHHVLRDEDKFLERSLIEVYDHRPRDCNATWNLCTTSIVIEEVGSCATLISHQLLSDGGLTESLAKLLYDVIIFDTIAFSVEAQKVRELDTVVSQQLQQQFDLCDVPKQRFQELWHAHNDVSHLTAIQLLFKDLKFVDGLPIPGLPMLVHEYLQLPNIHEHLNSFCDEIKYGTVIIMGLKVVGDKVFRDIAVFSRSDQGIRDSLVEILKANPELGLIESTVNVQDVTYFTQNNVKMSRKQILPIIKSCKR